jgi:hypothetical protein
MYKKRHARAWQNFERISDEVIYLRINQLQKGLLQFINYTNAERIDKEHGADIRLQLFSCV